MKIILIEPPIRYKDDRLPLGLLFISQYLNSNHYEHNLLTSSVLTDKELKSNNYVEIGSEKIIKIITEEKPDIIGVSVMISEQNYVIELSKIVKKILPDTTFVIGGPHPTSIPSVFFENTIDAIVIGEGERTFLDIVISKEKNIPLSCVDGIYYLDNDHFEFSKGQKFINNLDEIGFPNYKAADQRKIQSINYNHIRGVPIKCAYILSGRGCPFDCYFCAGKKVMGYKLRFRSIQNIKEEIEYLIDEYNIESIFFIDDTFTTDHKRVGEICELMKEYNLLWGCQATVSKLDPQMIGLLSGSGCIEVEVGIESASERIIHQMNMNKRKQNDVDYVAKVFKSCKRNNIRTSANFMIGFPYETYGEMKETMNMLWKIKPDVAEVWLLIPLPGTKLWDDIKFDIDPKDYHRLNFEACDVLKSSNKSMVKNIVKVRQHFYSKIAFLTLLSLLLNVSFVLKLILKFPYKLKRTYYYLRFTYRITKNFFRFYAKNILLQYKI